MIIKDHFRAASILTKVLDDQFNFFGIKIGIDPFLDFLPVIGSFLGVFLSLYLVWIAWKTEIPNDQIAKMIKNISIDFIIGEIPLVGIIGDALYKSNRMNLKILNEYTSKNIVEGEIV